MVEMSKSKIVKAENDIRDIINWVEILSRDETRDNQNKISPAAAKQLKKKLEDLAKKVSGMNITV